MEPANNARGPHEQRAVETNFKPNGSTGYATRQTILGSDWKFDSGELVKKPLLK
jgi:hypothetical protein